MLTNRATRLAVRQGHQTGSIRYVRYGFLLVCYSNFVPRQWDIRLQKCRDREIRSEVTQGHRNRHRSIRRLWLPINVP